MSFIPDLTKSGVILMVVLIGGLILVGVSTQLHNEYVEKCDDTYDYCIIVEPIDYCTGLIFQQTVIAIVIFGCGITGLVVMIYPMIKKRRDKKKL